MIFFRHRLQQDDTKDVALDLEIYLWSDSCCRYAFPCQSCTFTFGFAFTNTHTAWKWENLLEMSLLLADSAMTTGLLTLPEHSEKSRKCRGGGNIIQSQERSIWHQMAVYLRLSFFSFPKESKTMRPSVQKNEDEKKDRKRKVQRQEKVLTRFQIKWE